MGTLKQSSSQSIEIPRVGILVVSHGNSGRELVGAAEAIAGPLGKIEAVGHPSDESRSELWARVQEAAERVDVGAGLLYLCDLFGSTPGNVCLEVVRSASFRAEVVFGVNLAMLVKLSSLDRSALTPAELAVGLCETGRRSIKSGHEVEGGTVHEGTRGQGVR